MVARRQKSQMELAFDPGKKGETRSTREEGTEATMAKSRTESSASTTEMMEEICKRENMKEAIRRVERNKGGPGVDGMTVEELRGHLKGSWTEIREELLSGRYQPHPVKRVEIPKPSGGVRTLGVPTVTDRLIQQAILQVLQPKWDPTFSEFSFGFRPGRSAHDAVAQAQEYVSEGCRWVVDIDLEKFFDRVNHDMLMGRVAKRVEDKRLLRLIRSFLNAGVMANGLVSPTEEGTPQGGPLSPLLSNLVLDDLDRELERRGHRFARYADDCNIYVRSERAGHRVMESVSRYITKRLKLKVNREKSKVRRVQQGQFLGFGFMFGKDGAVKRKLAPHVIRRLKQRVRELTRRTKGRSLEQVIEDLARYLNGWRGYFGFCETPSVLKRHDAWIRRRLRAYVWKQWKRSKVRYRRLRALGLDHELAWMTAGSNRGPWAMSRNKGMNVALRIAYFDALGLPRLNPS
jgi:RNA-directed DNA polymerase